MGTRIPVSIHDNLVADPELSYEESGIAHAKLRVAVNQRFQAADGTWSDGIPVFHNVSAFRPLAENVVSSMKKGDPVTVTGDLEFRSYEKDGTQHEAHRIVAEVVGPDLRFGTSSYERTPKERVGACVAAQARAKPSLGLPMDGEPHRFSRSQHPQRWERLPTAYRCDYSIGGYLSGPELWRVIC